MTADALPEALEPRCDKCGAPLTTGFIAMFCPFKQECAFYVPGIEQFVFMPDFPELPQGDG